MTKEKLKTIAVVVVVVILAFLLLWFGIVYPKNTFKTNETNFEKAGKRYFSVNQKSVSKEEGRVNAVSLETLIKQKYMDDVYIPYSKKLCDIKNSTVKAVVKNGKTTYYTYLKCGRYESDVDHEGPVITLNGKEKITLNKNEPYQEAGVKSVVDKVDGTLDVSKVYIKGKVDSSKVGSYKISYSITDSLDNKTVLKRTVEVVEVLADTVTSATENGYYLGNAINNYILFNNMYFRIVKVNSDKTVTIVSEEALANVDYSANNGRFADSSLDKWLNDYFYNLLTKESKELIVQSAWCDDVITTDTLAKTDCSRSTDKRNVGILSLQDYHRTRTDTIKDSYLDSRSLTWYMNVDEKNKPWTLMTAFSYPESLEAMNDRYLINVRPAVTLKRDLKIVKGSGTQNDPFEIDSSSSGKKTEAINTRQVGETIKYSGYLWKIAGVESDGTTAIIMNETLKKDGEEAEIGYTNEDSPKVYNPKQKGNIGYQITYALNSLVDTSYFVKKEISVPIYKKNITYKGKHSTEKYNVKLSIPSTFEIFSAQAKNTTIGGYWLIDSSKQEDVKTIVFPIGSIPYEPELTDDITSGVKVKAYLHKDVRIKNGKGTEIEPYTLQK